jgi:voltage-gated potassium channel
VLITVKGGVDDDSILQELPARLRTEISLLINGDIIAKVPFFQNCNNGFITTLVQYLRPEIYMPGDYIITAGDVGTEMYFISQGEVEVVLPK